MDPQYEQISKRELEYLISQRDKEISNLKTEVKGLQTKNVNLEKELSDLKFSFHARILNSSKNFANETIEKLEKEIKSIEEESQKKEESLNNEIYSLRKINEEMVKKHRDYIESMQFKLSNVQAFDRAYTLQGKYINDIEKELASLKEDYKNKIQTKEIQNDLKGDESKKKWLKELANAKKYISKQEENGRNKSLKLTQLQYHELIIELDRQSNHIDQLLKEKDSLQELVERLQSDIQIHHEVEKVLTEKNKKLSFFLSQNSRTSRDHVNQRKKTNHKLILDEQNHNELSLAKNSTKSTFFETKRNKVQDSFDRFRRMEDRYKSVIKDIDELRKQNEALNVKNQGLKISLEKASAFDDNTINFVYHIINEVYLKMNSEENLKKYNEIKNGDSEKIKILDYENISSEVKYQIAHDIIKLLKPLLTDNKCELQKIKVKKSLVDSLGKKAIFTKTRNQFLSLHSISTVNDQKSFFNRNYSSKYY